VISVRPKVFCVPSIFPAASSRLVDFCLVQSPASQLLNTSERVLVTLHDEKDGMRLRLWSLDDGRCVMISPRDLTGEKRIVRVLTISNEAYPGWVMCVCEDSEVFIVSVYTMTFLKSFNLNFENL